MASRTPITPYFITGGLSRTTMMLSRSRNARPRLPSSNTPRGCRNNSSSSSSSSPSKPKSRVLQNPDKFRPPSHPARRVMPNKSSKNSSQPLNYPGPPPSEAELEARKTKKYPNMFPPEGSLMYRFLMDKSIHVWISLTVLFSLAGFTFFTNYKRTSPYAHLIPGWSDVLWHPFDSVSQVVTVMRMQAEHNTLESSEKRKQGVDDIEKRKRYRVAHGLEDPEGDEEGAAAGTTTADGAAEQGRSERRPVKKWLGIW